MREEEKSMSAGGLGSRAHQWLPWTQREKVAPLGRGGAEMSPVQQSFSQSAAGHRSECAGAAGRVQESAQPVARRVPGEGKTMPGSPAAISPRVRTMINLLKTEGQTPSQGWSRAVLSMLTYQWNLF